MAPNNPSLGFVFTARNLASAKMQRLEHRFTSLDERVTGGTNRMTTAFHQLGIGLAVFTTGASTVAGALSLANTAGRFEQGLGRHRRGPNGRDSRGHAQRLRACGRRRRGPGDEDPFGRWRAVRPARDARPCGGDGCAGGAPTALRGARPWEGRRVGPSTGSGVSALHGAPLPRCYLRLRVRGWTARRRGLGASSVA